jgi:hypothetical protein
MVTSAEFVEMLPGDVRTRLSEQRPAPVPPPSAMINPPSGNPPGSPLPTPTAAPVPPATGAGAVKR